MLLDFIQFIQEEEYNKEKPLNKLKKYSNIPNTYISFRTKLKFGINPKMSKQDEATPLGLYAYPLKEFWEKYMVDVEEKGIKPFSNIPFGKEMKYIYVFTPKNINLVIDLGSSYSETRLQKDINRLRRIYNYYMIDNQKIEELLEKLFSAMLEFLKFWGLEKYYDELKARSYNKDKKVFVRYYFDKEFGKYIKQEKIEKSKDDIKTNEYKEVADNFYSLIDEYNKTASKNTESAGFTFESILSTASTNSVTQSGSNNFGRYFWNITKIMSLLISQYKHKDLALFWHTLLKNLYTGITDKEGHGIIHTFEKLQAVFLIPDSLNVVEVIERFDVKEQLDVKDRIHYAK